MTTTPSPMFIGVERIVVACDLGTEMPEELRAALCEQLVRKAGDYTDYPVSAATRADLDPLSGELARQAEQLVLRVSGRIADVEPGRKSLSLTVAPVRLAQNLAMPPAEQSAASLVKVQNTWVLQGPIAAFEKLLSASRRPSLRAPLRSDK